MAKETKAAPKTSAAKAAPAKAAPKAAPAKPKAAAAAKTAPATDEATERRGFKRKLVGAVVSDKMDKTVVVEVPRRTRHAVYKKYVRSRASYMAHDETNQFKVGDVIEIEEHRPISRHKRWLATRLVSRPVEG